jgi:hypothetical protein
MGLTDKEYAELDDLYRQKHEHEAAVRRLKEEIVMLLEGYKMPAAREAKASAERVASEVATRKRRRPPKRATAPQPRVPLPKRIELLGPRLTDTPQTASELGAALGWPPSTVRTVLQAMQSQGAVETTKVSRVVNGRRAKNITAFRVPNSSGNGKGKGDLLLGALG